MRVVAIVGSAVHSGKTRAAVELAVQAATASNASIDADIIDLSKDRVSILDGRPLDQYSDQTAAVIRRIQAGTMFILGSPIYRGTYTGALKNLLDLTPLEALDGKVVGLIATAASVHHYLAIDHQFRGLLAWFNAYTLPGSVYVDNSAYTDGRITSPQSLAHLRQLGESLVGVACRLAGTPANPPCLTRQVMETARK